MSDEEKKPPIEIPDLENVPEMKPEPEKKKQDYTHRADHLKAHQFVKGRSGNPGGKRKKIVTENYLWALKQKLPDDTCLKAGVRKGTTWGQLGALGMVKKMVEGDSAAAKEVRESIQGKLEPESTTIPEFGRVAVDLNVNVHEQLKSATARLRDRLAKQSGTVQ